MPQIVAVNCCLLLGFRKLGDFLLSLYSSCGEEDICLLGFMCLAGKFKGKHGEYKVQYNDYTVHEFHNNGASCVEQIGIYRKGVFQNVIYNGQQHEQTKKHLTFMLQAGDTGGNITDNQKQERNRDQDGANIGNHRIVACKGSDQRTEPFTRCTEQVGCEHGDDGNIGVPVAHKADQQN